MRFVVRGKNPDGKSTEVDVMDLSTVLSAVRDLDRRGVTDVALVETDSGLELDLKKVLDVKRH